MELSFSQPGKSFLQALGRVQRQIPFATSQALNDTAFDVRKQIVESTYPKSFNVRNRSFPRVAFRVIKANKRRLVAQVHDHHLILVL